MRIAVVGASGTLGSAIVAALTSRHEVIRVGHREGTLRVDLEDPDSIARMYEALGDVNGVVCAAGEARFGPLAQLTDEDFALSIRSKLMGQVNVVRRGFAAVADGGSITVTSGVLARKPTPGSAAISLVNAGLEGFVAAAALEAPRRIRVNAVSPPWVVETLRALGMDTAQGLPAAAVAQAYVASVEGWHNGEVLVPSGLP
ncbi:MAG: short chain dehydrogenase [Gemmatimonadales bacterium]